MNIWVINLQHAVKRRAEAARQLNSFGLKHHFFDAIDGKEGFRYFSGYNESVYRLNTGRLPGKGEIGCYASHLALWKKCVKANQPFLIMEDDFALLPLFPMSIGFAKRVINQYGFIRFEPHKKKKIPVLKNNIFSLNYCPRYTHCATCYAINPSVAAKFVEHSQILSAPVDKFIRFFWLHKQPLYTLEPATVIHGPLSSDSNIQQAWPKSSNFLRIRRQILKCAAYFYRASFNFQILQHLKNRKQAIIEELLSVTES